MTFTLAVIVIVCFSQNGTLKNENPSESVNWNRLSELLNLPSSELAQKVVALQMMLQEREISLQNLQSRHRNAEILLQHQNEEMDINNRKLKEAIAKVKLFAVFKYKVEFPLL